ncbi:MAG: 2-oxoglutarate dehydrogenase E1 component, partial [Rhodospirillaceae bacterium]|nr:2-oxoglutarate dehydrogenase E1 component [Rhodospirillaceae bacterium]
MAVSIDHASFLTGGNAIFVAELYGRYLASPESVDPSWAAFFEDMKLSGEAMDDLDAAKWGRMRASVIEPNGHGGNGHSNDHTNGAAVQEQAQAVALATQGATDPAAVRAATLDSIRALMMIR